MKKTNILIIGIFIIAMVLYNLILFSIKSSFDVVFWSAYGFTMFAFIAYAATLLVMIGHSKNMDDALLSVPIIITNTIYFLAQLILGIAIMSIPIFSLKIANIFQISVLSITAIIDLMCMIGKNTTK